MRPVAKAAEDSDADYKWLQRIADSLLPDVRRAFMEAVERLRGSIAEHALRDAIESGNVEAAIQALSAEVGNGMTAAMTPTLTEPLEDAFIEAARAAPDHVPPSLILPQARPSALLPAGEPPTLGGGSMSMRFDLGRPASVQFIKDYDFGLIKQVSQDTRAAIRNIVLRAFQSGGHPTQQAKQIKSLIGLTDRQATAAANYRAALVEEGRKADQVERMAAKYSDRLLRMRAVTIARTETMRASNAGQHAAWQQAANDGFLNRNTVRRRWIVTPDDRLCIYCAAVPAMNPDGVPLDGMFMTPLGPVLYGPLHPQCRCIVALMGF